MTREEAIKGLKALAKDFSGYRPNEEMFNMAIEALEQLPSAQRWIPISERLPEVDEDVLVSYHYNGEGEFFPSFDGVRISSWTGIKNHNKPHFYEMGCGITVHAWMPLPELYKEDENE